MASVTLLHDRLTFKSIEGEMRGCSANNVTFLKFFVPKIFLFQKYFCSKNIFVLQVYQTITEALVFPRRFSYNDSLSVLPLSALATFWISKKVEEEWV